MLSHGLKGRLWDEAVVPRLTAERRLMPRPAIYKQEELPSHGIAVKSQGHRLAWRGAFPSDICAHRMFPS